MRYDRKDGRHGKSAIDGEIDVADDIREDRKIWEYTLFAHYVRVAPPPDCLRDRLQSTARVENIHDEKGR